MAEEKKDQKKEEGKPEATAQDSHEQAHGEAHDLVQHLAGQFQNTMAGLSAGSGGAIAATAAVSSLPTDISTEVWHASPSSFEKFDIGKAGSKFGEAYGKGLYFSSEKGIPEGYGKIMMGEMKMPGYYMYRAKIPYGGKDLPDYYKPVALQGKDVQKAAQGIVEKHGLTGVDMRDASLQSIHNRLVGKNMVGRGMEAQEAMHAATREMTKSGIKGLYIDAPAGPIQTVFSDKGIKIMEKRPVGMPEGKLPEIRLGREVPKPGAIGRAMEYGGDLVRYYQANPEKLAGQAGETLAKGAASGLMQMGIEGAANELIPMPKGDDYWSEVGKNLRAAAIAGGAGYATMGPMGAITSIGTTTAMQAGKAGSAFYDYYKQRQEAKETRRKDPKAFQ